MSSPVHFAPLDSDDAGRIGRLQRRLFPVDLTEPEIEIRQILLNTERHLVCNLSFGLFSRREMVGYVFAYVETESLVHARAEEIVYIKEIALLPGYENHMRGVFEKLYALWCAYVPGLPLEAHAQVDALAQWRRLQRVFRFYGLTLTAMDERRKPGKPSYHLLRFDVAHDTVKIASRAMEAPAIAWRSPEGIEVAVATAPRQWLALKDPWDRLVGATPGCGIEHSFEYLWQWWKYCGIWRELHLVVFREAGNIIGIAPLMIETVASPVGPFRRMRFVGSPERGEHPRLLFGQANGRCMQALVGYLQHAKDVWDVLEIEGQSPGDATLFRQKFTAGGYRVREIQGAQRSAVHRVAAWSQPPSRETERHVQSVRGAQAVSEHYDAYCELEEGSRKAGENRDLADSKESYYFHRGLIESLRGACECELWLLNRGGKAVAGRLGIIRGDECFLLHGACAEDPASRGAMEQLDQAVLADLGARGVIRCEAAPGEDIPLGRGWEAIHEEPVSLHVYRNTLRSRALSLGRALLGHRKGA